MACPLPEASHRLTPTVYRPRRPEKSVLYQTIQKELETWLETRAVNNDIPRFVEDEFRSFLKCGILAHGFARAHCHGCGHDFLIAFSCKGRGICPSCNARHMAQIAAHLVDHVFPKVPVRQWVLSLPKRLRYFLHHHHEYISPVLNILISAVESQLIQSCSNGANLSSGCRLGSVTFLQRFGKALNPHFHFHCCIIDGVFDKEGNFYPANFLSPVDIQSVQEQVRKRVVRLFQRRGYLNSNEASDMLGWDHGGFSLDANVRIEAQDRAGLERLIRYCARPIFSGERLDCIGDKLRYILPKPTADGQMVLLLKPFELLDKLSSLIPPPRRHRHHYHGVLAPNSPLRSKIASFANKEISPAPFSGGCPASAINCQEEPKVEIDQKALISPPPNQSPEIVAEMQDRPKDKKQPSKASLFRWAMLLARIFEVFPLCCPKCNHPMRIISFIQDEHSIRKVLTHLNEPIQPPPITPARGPPEPEFNYDQSYEFA